MSNGEQEGRLCNKENQQLQRIRGAINSDTSKQLRLDMQWGILIVNDAKMKGCEV